MSALNPKTCAQALGVFQLGRADYCGKQVSTECEFCDNHGPRGQGLFSAAYLSSIQRLAESAQMGIRWVAR